MNIAYFRNSTRSMAETLAELKTAAEAKGFSILGESGLPDGKTTVVTICKPDLAQKVVDTNPDLMGLLPCSVTILEKDGQVMVGTGTPTLLGQVARSEEMLALVESADAELHSIIDRAAGVDPLKPKSLILYSSHTCPYCSMEKDWLDQKGVDYKLVYVDEDQQAAVSLVSRSGQQGVPQTEVIYDNDDAEFIIGFDRPKLEQIIAAM